MNQFNLKDTNTKKGILLYHGNKDSKIIPKYQTLSNNKIRNDLGNGFYLVIEEEKAKEWSHNIYSTQIDYSCCHIYNIDLYGLKYKNYLGTNNPVILLEWIANLLYYRFTNNNLKGLSDYNKNKILSNRDKFINKFFINNHKLDYDYLISYRGDDNFKSYMLDFLSNNLYVEDLLITLLKGDLGVQIVIISEKGFSKLKKIRSKKVGNGYKDKYDRINERVTNMYTNNIFNVNKDKLSIEDLIILNGEKKFLDTTQAFNRYIIKSYNIVDESMGYYLCL